MIRELVDYARTHNLITQPGYTQKAVHWAIDIAPDGRYLGVTALGDPSGRNHRGVTFSEAPHLEQPELIAGGQPRCHFLIETVAVVTNWPDEKGKNAAKHRAFLQLLAKAKPEVPELAEWERCLQDPWILEKIRADLKHQRAKGTDRITVRMAGKFLVERRDWHPWWDAYRRSLQSPGEESIGTCLVTGEQGPIAQTHPKIMGLAAVGGNSAGSALVSFDKDAFSSYGLVQGNNAAIGRHVAVAYQNALNALIQRGLTLSGIRVVYWYREPVSADQDLLAFLGQPRNEDRERQALFEAERGLRQVLTGGEPVAMTNRFYMLLLSGVAGRVMVRSWYEGSYENLQQNIVQWFSDLETVRPDGGLPRLPPFSALLRQLTVRKDEEVPAPDVRGLWEAAVFNRPIPLAIAHRGLNRIRHDIVLGNVPHPDVIAVMKSYLNRNRGGNRIMNRALDPNRPEVSYHLGRLLAIMDQLYAADDRDARGLLASRYFRAASTTPLVVFGRLLSLAEYYLARLESNQLKQWFRNHLMEVTNRITAIPRSLSFEDQAIFALGYYHQLAQLRGGKN